jgi:hypothetical protein
MRPSRVQRELKICAAPNPYRASSHSLLPPNAARLAAGYAVDQKARRSEALKLRLPLLPSVMYPKVVSELMLSVGASGVG